MDDSCRLFTNEYSLTLTLTAIRLVQDDSELVLEHDHCPDDNFQFIPDLKPCQVNDVLKPDATCYSGVVLADADRPGEGVASGVIVLTLQTACTAIELAPCSDEEVIALAPSPEKPVLIRWDDECSNCEVSVPRRRDPAPQTETPLPSATSPDQDHTP